METNPSKPLKDKELVEELGNQLCSLKVSYDVLFEEYTTTKDQLNQLKQEDKRKPVGAEEPKHVEETQKDYIEELIRQIEDKDNTIKELEDASESFKVEKDHADQSKAKLETQVKEQQLEISQLQLNLKDARKHLQQKGEICKQDCVSCCLLWICQKKLDENPCGRHLEKNITIYAEREFGPITKNQSRCHAFMSILVQCKIVHKILNETYCPSSPTAIEDDDRDKMINEVWQTLMKLDAGTRVLIVARVISRAERTGHCVVCDLETRNGDNLTYCDLQKNKEEEWNQNSFKSFVKDDEGIKFYTVDLEKLKRIIEDHKDSSNKPCNTSPTPL